MATSKQTEAKTSSQEAKNANRETNAPCNLAYAGLAAV